MSSNAPVPYSATPALPAMTEGEPALDLLKWWAIFRRRILLFGIIFGAIFALGVLFVAFSPEKYTGTASVMVDTRQRNITKTPDVIEGLPTATGDASLVDTQVELIKSRQLADRVVTELQLDRDPEFNGALKPPSLMAKVAGSVKGVFGRKEPEQTLQEKIDNNHDVVVNIVHNNVQVARNSLTYVIGISFDSESPEKAAKIVNTFADDFLALQTEAKVGANQQAGNWLNQRLEQLRSQVLAADNAVQQYRIANNLLTTTGATLTEQEISQFNQQTAGAKEELAEDEARLRTAKSQLAAGSTGDDLGEALGSSVITQLRSQRAAISAQVADMQGRYGPLHPDLLKAQRQLADIDMQISAEINRIVSNLQAKVDVSRQRAASMNSALQQSRGTLAANNAASVRLAELQRNSEAARTLYDEFLNRYKEVSSQDGLQSPDARIVSRAVPDYTVTSPKTGIDIAVTVAVALAMGLGAVIFAELLDSGLSTADDVERRLGVPCFSSIPLLSSMKGSKRDTPARHIVAKPMSIFSEAFRNLRAALVYSPTARPVKVVVVTSALPGEGKTATSVCLARSAALQGHRTVIVDCDLRRPAVNNTFNMETPVGLLEVLSGQAKLDDVMIHDEQTGTYLLPIARHRTTPEDVFDTPAMENLLDKLRHQFDLIVLDTPPVLAVADTRTLARKADVVLVLAQWRKTPRKAIDAALKILEGSGAVNIGMALTKVNLKKQVRAGYGDPMYYYPQYAKYYAN